MSNFECAVLVPGSVCWSALMGYRNKEQGGLHRDNVVYSQIYSLTNNGVRDAYLNPEQADFVNRWSA